jgi:uncharacterized protein YggE
VSPRPRLPQDRGSVCQSHCRQQGARRLAIAAAQEKAQIYANAAGVSIGHVLHIQDVNPQVLQGRGEGHVQREQVVSSVPLVL